jgi:hypothetical protein
VNDDHLQKLLTQADERLGRTVTRTPSHGHAEFVKAVCRRHARRLRRRRNVGVLAVVVVLGGLSVWSLSAGPGPGIRQAPQTIASNAAAQPNGAESKTTVDGPASTTGGGARRRLPPTEIKRIQAEVAALDAEANRASRLVDLYRAAEVRREQLAVLEAAPAEPVLPPDMLAELEIDRAAAITVTSADAQANQFNQPDEAAESYQSVITLFPSSRWASIARQRLARIQHMN